MEEKRLGNSPIYYYVTGNEQGECILFLHAAFVNHSMFDKQIEYFKDKYKIITIDLIGHGKSVETQKGDSVESMAEWIQNILNYEKIEKVHLVGVSLGAIVIQDFANKYPNSVLSIACFGGYDINNFEKKMQKGNGLAQMLMMFKAIFSIKWFAEDNKKISASTENAREEFYQMNIHFPKKSFMYLASLNRMVNKHVTQKREYNVLVGCGEHDIPMELLAIDQWQKREPAIKKVVFKGAGHCVNMDVPDEFNHKLEEFWSEKF